MIEVISVLSMKIVAGKPNFESESVCRWYFASGAAEDCGRAGLDSFRFILLKGEAHILTIGFVINAWPY